MGCYENVMCVQGFQGRVRPFHSVSGFTVKSFFVQGAKRVMPRINMKHHAGKLKGEVSSFPSFPFCCRPSPQQEQKETKIDITRSSWAPDIISYSVSVCPHALITVLVIHNVQGCPCFARIAGHGIFYFNGTPTIPTHCTNWLCVIMCL